METKINFTVPKKLDWMLVVLICAWLVVHSMETLF